MSGPPYAPGVSEEIEDIEDLFDPLDGEPPEWGLMLTLVVDESKDDASGMWFAAGFLGHKDQWKQHVKLWREARYPLDALHFTDMYLGKKGAPKKWGDRLIQLGRIPHTCGLQPFAGSIRTSDYRERVSGTVLAVLMEGYALAVLALLDEVAKNIPVGQRIQVIFEESITHASLRARAMACWIKSHRTPSGWPVVPQWTVRQKGTLHEASDYLCYALRQFYLNENSQKAKLTSPILNPWPTGNHTSKQTVDKWLDEIKATRIAPVPVLTPELKARTRYED